MGTRRLYYDDSFLTNFETRVLKSVPVAEEGKPPAWKVWLEESAFYPTSGGQPNDLGCLNGVPVLDVRDEDGEVVHIVGEPLADGSVTGAIEWERRFDHMQQHTGQHLLSAMFDERFGLPTVSFHLGEEYCSIDLRGPEPSLDVLEGAERAANRVIFEDRPITVRYGTAEQFEEMGVRKKVEREGILRAIEIEGADLQPCGGTHVRRTGQIGMILVRRCTKMRQDWRVEFVCGARANRMAHSDFVRLKTTAEKLKCSMEETVATAERLVAESDATFKRLRSVSEQLAEADAKAAIREIAPREDGLRVIARLVEGVDASYLAAFATHLAKEEKTAALLVHKETGQVVLAENALAGKDMNALLKKLTAEFGGKGGGTSHFVRGAIADKSKSEAAIAWLKKNL